MIKRNIFIVGRDDFNFSKLQQLPQAEFCDFHAALELSAIRNVAHFDMPGLIDEAIRTMSAFPGTVDGVVSYFDFPGTVMVPILARYFNLPGPDLQAVLKCENKYWSRLEQKKVIPDNIPQFRVFDPFDDLAFDRLNLLPPFWIKPIKSYRSFLAFLINSRHQFNEAMAICRSKGDLISAPFAWLMEHYSQADELAAMRETFIAETLIGGAQCTLEGYVLNGNVTVYGVVDSVREQNSSSFSRYEYPSSLPLEIQHRMIEVTRLALNQIGLDNTPFNVEFFYDQTTDQVWLLEINPRASQGHADIFEKVHGIPNLSVMVDLALQRKPKPMQRSGDFNLAAHFMLRTLEAGTVERIPSQTAIDTLTRRQPGTIVRVNVTPGQHLDDLQGQDMYSYELASVFIGGRDQIDILDKYDEALAALQFDIRKDVRPVIR